MTYEKKNIRFIDPDYRTLFFLPDGANIRITYPTGDDRGTITRPCKHLDEMHVRIGNETYHICQFAERMAAVGARFEPEMQLYSVEITPFPVGGEDYFDRDTELGCTRIGQCIGDFGNQGDSLQYSWHDRNDGIKRTPFLAERDSAIYALRDSILKDRAAMLAYCQDRPEALLNERVGFAQYGFKMETDERQYFILCHVSTESIRDSRFCVYAFDKSVPQLEKELDSEKKTVALPGKEKKRARRKEMER